LSRTNVLAYLATASVIFLQDDTKCPNNKPSQKSWGVCPNYGI